MSETKYKDTACTTRATKSSKPFCSLAYLAKSTIAVNNSNDVRIVNGIGNYQVNSPNVAATAKVNERCSPTLPTGANTNSSGVNGYKTTHNGSPVNGNASSKEDTQNLTKTAAPQSNGHKSTADIFGVINEEQEPALADEVDGAVDPSRPWQLSNGYCKRVPPSLMTTTHNGYNGYCSNGLTSLTKLNSLDCWDYTIELECLKGPQDLQLAAELGKTLLERNKELETLLKEHKSTIEEQEQEIVYLKKHTTALREVNDSRLKVYEQLEVGIQDLERANHRLLVENTNDKKHIKNLVHNVEGLESRCEDLTRTLEEARQTLSMERRKIERLMEEKRNVGAENTNVIFKSKEINLQSTNVHDSSTDAGFEPNTSAPEEQCSFMFQSPSNANSTDITENINDITALSLMCGNGEENEEIIKIVNDLESTKKAFISEQQRCTELEEQLVAIIQENQTLQGRIAQTNSNEEMKSMHEELSILDEVRQGQMCSRCLRSVEDRLTVNDEQSSIAPTEEGGENEERSLLELEDGNCDDNASEQSQVAYRPNVSIKADKATCPICLKSTTKYLHEQLPNSFEAIILDLWQKTMRKFTVVRWIAKILHWPALVICRMINSIPDDEDFALIF